MKGFKSGENWNGNKNGRPKTSFSISLRGQVTEFCEANAGKFLNEILNMKPSYAKSQAFIALLNFCLPKLTEANSKLDVSSMTDQEVERVLDIITKN